MIKQYFLNAGGDVMLSQTEIQALQKAAARKELDQKLLALQKVPCDLQAIGLAQSLFQYKEPFVKVRACYQAPFWLQSFACCLIGLGFSFPLTPI